MITPKFSFDGLDEAQQTLALIAAGNALRNANGIRKRHQHQQRPNISAQMIGGSLVEMGSFNNLNGNQLTFWKESVDLFHFCQCLSRRNLSSFCPPVIFLPLLSLCISGASWTAPRPEESILFYTRCLLCGIQTLHHFLLRCPDKYRLLQTCFLPRLGETLQALCCGAAPDATILSRTG